MTNKRIYCCYDFIIKVFNEFINIFYILLLVKVLPFAFMKPILNFARSIHNEAICWCSGKWFLTRDIKIYSCLIAKFNVDLHTAIMPRVRYSWWVEKIRVTSLISDERLVKTVLMKLLLHSTSMYLTKHCLLHVKM